MNASRRPAIKLREGNGGPRRWEDHDECMNAVTSRVDGSHLSATNHNIKAAAATNSQSPQIPKPVVVPRISGRGAQRFGALSGFAKGEAEINPQSASRRIVQSPLPRVP